MKERVAKGRRRELQIYKYHEEKDGRVDCPPPHKREWVALRECSGARIVFSQEGKKKRDFKGKRRA